MLLGLVIYGVPIQLLNKLGIVIIFIITLSLVLTGCSFNIMGASSLLYHDVLLTYINVGTLKIDYSFSRLNGMSRRIPVSCVTRSVDDWQARGTSAVVEVCSNAPTVRLIHGC